MIYYFSGLGNTRYVAESIGKIIEEEIRFIPDVDAQKETAFGNSIGFLFPIYSWGLPKNVVTFMKELTNIFWDEIRIKEIPVWIVCSCGDETGDAPALVEKILTEKGISLAGGWSVIMPNTYVLLPGFDVDSKKLETEKLQHSKIRVTEIGNKIKSKEWVKDFHKGSFPRLRTKLIYPLFLKKGINPKKWKHSSACVKCGKCIKACSINNIFMGEGGPVWGNNCISCLACYHNCPYHAVKYGSITKSKGQYLCPL